MELRIIRAVDPDSLTLTLRLTQDDFDAAISNQADPDEQLFFDVMGPVSDRRKASVRLSDLSKLLGLVEGDSADHLEGAVGSPIPKP